MTANNKMRPAEILACLTAAAIVPEHMADRLEGNTVPVGSATTAPVVGPDINQAQAVCKHCRLPIYDNGTVWVHHFLVPVMPGDASVFGLATQINNFIILESQWCNQTMMTIAEAE